MSDKAPSNLKELTARLLSICEDGVDVPRVKAAMKAYKSNEEDWRQYMFLDDKKYTRNLVDEGNNHFNLLVLCWNKGQRSTIHAHQNADCVMKILSGTVTEERFHWPEGEHEMVPTGEFTYTRDQVAHINDSMGLHRVSNPSTDEPAVTLHMYFPPFSQCGVFDEATGKRSTGQMLYYSKFGKKCDEGEGQAKSTCCGGKSCCN